MNIPKTETFRIRIIAIFSTISLLLVLVTALASYRFIRAASLEEISAHALGKAKYFASSADSSFFSLLSMGKPSPAVIKYFQELSERFSLSGGDDIFIVNGDLQMILHSSGRNVYGMTDAALLLYRKECTELPAGKGFSSTPFKGSDGKWYLWGVYKADADFLYVIRESAERFEKLDDFAMIFWLIGAAGALITFFSAAAVARSLTRPVENLISFSEKIGKGDLNAKMPERVRGELGILANAMDSMRQGLADNQKEREKLLAQIAHEIRNPLGGIELLANLIREDLPVKTKMREYIDRILKEVAGLKSLITSFLEFSKPNDIRPEWVDVKEIFGEITENFRIAAPGNKPVITQLVTEGKILFDRNSLKQILLNLVRNSVQACAPEPRVELVSSREGNHRRISVSDNGPGLRDEDMKNLYSSFYTTKKEGTGLGLAICKKLANANGATIEAKNNAGRGCTFSIVKETADNEK